MWHRFLKLLYYIVLLLYVVATTTLLAVLTAAEWHSELLRFLYRVWLAFLAHVGSTGAGFISPIILAVLSIVGTMVCVGFIQGAAAMVKHWWETALYAGVVLVTAMLLVYGPQFIWQMARVAHQDHQMLAAKNKSLTAENEHLGSQLQDAESNAEQRCEQANGQEIKRLKRQLNAACYLPDRHLTAEQREYLFVNLKRFANDIRKQGKTPTIRIAVFTGDRESSAFARTLWDVFTNAGWTIKVDTSAEGQKKAKEQEQWIFQHGIITGVVVLEPPSAKGLGMWLSQLFVQSELPFAGPGPTFSNADVPHLEDLTLWVGYKTFP